MRTTITIDDDVLAAARQLADLRGESIGRIVSELARASLSGTLGDSMRNGIRLLPVNPGAKGATLEEVNQLRDELL